MEAGYTTRPVGFTHEESAHALLRAGGRCQHHRCRARALETVRRHPDGWWARFDYHHGFWVDPKGARVPAHEIAEVREVQIQLRVVLVAATAPSLYAGRVLVLCQACDGELNQPPSPPVARPLELPL